MDSEVKAVMKMARRAMLDCAPYAPGEDGTGYFIRNGANGHWLSQLRKTPRAAWKNAADRMRSAADDQLELPRGPRA
jgi:hypothetical protein